MSSYLGDFRTGKTIRKMWNSNAIAGESITRATNGTISVYKDGNTTQSTTGVTDTEDYDSLTGVHLVVIDTSADGTFYSSGSDFEVVLSGATIDGKTINATLFSFSLQNRSALMPTTDGRLLDVSAGGEAGIDWANVGSPTTVVGLSGTTVKTATDVETDTADIQSRIPAVLVSGRMDSSVGAMVANTLTASALASDAVTEIQSGLSTLDAAGVRSAVGLASANLDTQLAAVQSDTNDIQTRLPAALVSGRMDSSVGAMASNTITASAVAADAVTEIQSGLATGTDLATVAGYVDTEVTAIYSRIGAPAGASIAADIAAISTGSAPTAEEIADAVWDEAITDHQDSGSTGAALNAAGSAGDPWSTPLPGAYGSGTAGNIVGNRLDASVNSRSSHTAADVWAVGTRTLTGFGTLIADIWANATRSLTTVDKTGYSLVSSEHTSIADALLKRDWTAVTGAASRSVLNALRFLRNKWSISSNTLTVTQEDDTTTAWTATVTRDADAEPITGNDPS